MKRVPSLEAEPEDLAQWRADNPEDHDATALAAKGAWGRFKSSGVYLPLVHQLVARQQGLCGYCEQRLTKPDGSLVVNDYQVEHVLAKSGGPGRILDWHNFMLCCWGGTWAHHPDPSRHADAPRGSTNLSCGQAKGNADIPASCDPRSLPWREPVVRIDVDGRIVPNEEACRPAGIETSDLRRVIADLGLNCDRLRVARQKAIANLDEWIMQLLEETFATSHLPSDELAKVRELLIKGRLCPDRRGHLRQFWTTERLYFGEAAEAWIHANAALLHFS